MAIIKAVSSKASIGKAIKYVTKEEKTEEKLISGKDCNPETAIDEMKATKEQWKKTQGRQYKHLVQSFKDTDNITPEQAHKIGRELIENTKKFKGFEVLIVTHKDKKHIHNHFIINSVNYENGLKYQQSKKDLEELKKHSDRICEREGLSIVKEKSKEITSFNQNKYQLLKRIDKGERVRSYLLDTALAVEKGLKGAIDRQTFIKNMECQGYRVNWKNTRKYITFTTPEGKKVRNSNLEKTFKDRRFSKEGLENELAKLKEQSRGMESRRNKYRTDTATNRESSGEDTSNVDWTAIGASIENERIRVSKQPSNDVTREIQQKVRAVKDRTKRAIGESREENKQSPKLQRNINREPKNIDRKSKPKIRKRSIEHER